MGKSKHSKSKQSKKASKDVDSKPDDSSDKSNTTATISPNTQTSLPSRTASTESSSADPPAPIEPQKMYYKASGHHSELDPEVTVPRDKASRSAIAALNEKALKWLNR